MMSNTAEEVTPHAAQQVFVAQSTTSQEPLCDLERARLISPSCHLSFEEQDAPCSSLSSLQLPLRKSSSAGDLTSAENSTACLDVDSEELLVWVNSVIKSYKLQVNNLDESFQNGMALCALIHNVNPTFFDFALLDAENSFANFNLAFLICQQELGIAPPCSVEQVIVGDVDPKKFQAFLEAIHIISQAPHEIPPPALEATQPTDRWVATCPSIPAPIVSRHPSISSQRPKSSSLDYRSPSSSIHLLTRRVSEQSSCLMPFPHDFRRKHFNSPTYCNVCTRFLWGIGHQGYECTVCGYVAHKKCKHKAPDNCEPPVPLDASDMLSQDFVELARSHHWIEGNMQGRKRCFECGKSFRHKGAFDGCWCSKCHIAVHTQCMKLSKCNPILGNLYYYGAASPENVTPLICFVNSKSGGQKGLTIMRRLSRLLNRSQVFDILDGGPQVGLEKYKNTPNLRILVCGGDGTVCWVLSVLDKMTVGTYPPIAVLPLGTGNDLARTLNWGPGYNNEPMEPILLKVERAGIQPMDRWRICYSEGEEAERKEFIMNNYFSIGVDAAVALNFHQKREEKPHLFQSRTINKGWYGKFGAEAMVSRSNPLHNFVTIEVDGQPIAISKDLEGIMVLNIPSYAGGCGMWGKSKNFKPPALDDGLLEVVAVTGIFHMSKIQAKVSKARKIAQCSQMRIKTTAPAAVQIDGEPSLQQPCEITIEFFNRVNMLTNSKTASASPRDVS